MRARLLLTVTAALLLIATGGGAAASAKEKRPTGRAGLERICLVTPGVPDGSASLLLPAWAVDALIERTQSYRGPCAEYGESAELGEGEITAYAQSVGRRPVAVGMVMSEASFEGLPHDPPTQGLWCYDKDEDGHTDPMEECTGGYEKKLDLPQAFRDRVDTPFTYVLNNWNPHGHIPLGVYDKPHYDVHFYMNDNAERLAIRPGPCPQLVHCDDYPKGKRLPADQYLPPDFEDLDAVEPGMGNHLVDPTAPEFNGEPFRHTWIYGVWDGAFTFYEPMITKEHLDGLRGGSVESGCHEFKQPGAWQRSGWYPTTYCLRYRDNRQEVTVSLEDFEYRRAS